VEPRHYGAYALVAALAGTAGAVLTALLT
jgi:hypothetical protein